jgi:hypothetical protein
MYWVDKQNVLGGLTKCIVWTNNVLGGRTECKGGQTE